MGNIFSHINCFSCKNRPTSIFGKKKRRHDCNIYPMGIITPLHSDFPIQTAELVNNPHGTITYNPEPPHLINPIISPLTEHITEHIHYVNNVIQPTSSTC